MASPLLLRLVQLLLLLLAERAGSQQGSIFVSRQLTEMVRKLPMLQPLPRRLPGLPPCLGGQLRCYNCSSEDDGRCGDPFTEDASMAGTYPKLNHVCLKMLYVEYVDPDQTGGEGGRPKFRRVVQRWGANLDDYRTMYGEQGPEEGLRIVNGSRLVGFFQACHLSYCNGGPAPGPPPLLPLLPLLIALAGAGDK